MELLIKNVIIDESNKPVDIAIENGFIKKIAENYCRSS